MSNSTVSFVTVNKAHNFHPLIPFFRVVEVRTAEAVGPVLIHVITDKGHGYAPAETAQDKMHGVVMFDPLTGKQSTTAAKVRSGLDTCPLLGLL